MVGNQKVPGHKTKPRLESNPASLRETCSSFNKTECLLYELGCHVDTSRHRTRHKGETLEGIGPFHTRQS
jgi:hypothetical protein